MQNKVVSDVTKFKFPVIFPIAEAFRGLKIIIDLARGEQQLYKGWDMDNLGLPTNDELLQHYKISVESILEALDLGLVYINCGRIIGINETLTKQLNTNKQNLIYRNFVDFVATHSKIKVLPHLIGPNPQPIQIDLLSRDNSILPSTVTFHSGRDFFSKFLIIRDDSNLELLKTENAEIARNILNIKSEMNLLLEKLAFVKFRFELNSQAIQSYIASSKANNDFLVNKWNNLVGIQPFFDRNEEFVNSWDQDCMQNQWLPPNSILSSKYGMEVRTLLLEINAAIGFINEFGQVKGTSEVIPEVLNYDPQEFLGTNIFSHLTLREKFQLATELWNQYVNKEFNPYFKHWKTKTTFFEKQRYVASTIWPRPIENSLSTFGIIRDDSQIQNYREIKSKLLRKQKYMTFLYRLLSIIIK